MLVASINEAIPLRLLAADGTTTLYGQLHVYNASGLLVANLVAVHMAEGLYTVNWTPTIEGHYTVLGQFFIDAGLTQDAGYERVTEEVDVSSMKANVLRILGLLHENSVVDSQSYDGQGNLVAARIRSYDSKPNALSAGGTGLLASYTVAATYSVNQLVDYRVVRDA